ncbi:hypothetical protein ATW7_08104 [Alteromonadales bacterium TW-7]|nr:hypothetical protein ATW7_08104 [Alteromonadales bacterium TW-7]
MKKNKIILCTARYSDNLGDGIISDCTRELLNRSCPVSSVVDLDISGRTTFSLKDDKSCDVRSKLKNLVLNAPDFVKYIIVVLLWFFISKKKLKKELESILTDDVKFLVFGGGQLILDNFLSFPLKFSYISKLANKKNIPIVVLGCGVGVKKSWLAEYFYKKAFSLNSFKSVFLRDTKSVKSFEARFGSSFSGKLGLTYDSALYSSETYNIKKKKSGEKLIIGLGLSHPSELKAGSTASHDFNFKKLANLWVELISKLNETNYEIVLYTNGSSEDELFLDKVYSHFCDNVTRLPRPKNPAELIQNICRLDITVSHRLHSSIISTSLEIPSIGLTWDDKVLSFYKAIGRENFCLSGDNFTFVEIDEKIKSILNMNTKTKICDLKQAMIQYTNDALKEI